MMLSVGVGGIRVSGSYFESSIAGRFNSFSFQTHHGVQSSSDECLLERLREFRLCAFSQRKGGTISNSEVSSDKDTNNKNKFHKPFPEAKVARVRLSGLPKKRNICNDLWSAFWEIPEIINIIPVVNENTRARNAPCKGFAFVDFRFDEDAARFVQRFSGQKINFGNVLKKIKCAVISTSLYSAARSEHEDFESIDAAYSAPEAANPESSGKVGCGGTSPSTEVDQGCNKLVHISKGVDRGSKKTNREKGKHVCVAEVLSNEDVMSFNRPDGPSSHGHAEDCFVSDNQCIFSFDETSVNYNDDDEDDDTDGLSVLWEDEEDEEDEEAEELDIGSLLFNVDEGSSSFQAPPKLPNKPNKSKRKVKNKRR